MGRQRHKNRNRDRNNPGQKKRHRDGPGYHDNRDQQGYKLTIRENEMFETYYKEQKIVPEAEWEEFMTSLRSSLPSTFRVTGFKSEAQELLKIITNKLNDLVNVNIDEPVDPPKNLSWYPGGNAWQINLPRSAIRKSSAFEKLHKFLVTETESGFISRQEAVSMIPPLLLDVQPQHKVLDMCAAPGSKTTQLIELLHGNDDVNAATSGGLVIANDSDNKRCYLMVHQVKRLQSPCFMIINHDASILPQMKITGPNGNTIPLLYDRILADVPCSGDGTLRKNPDIWRKWTSANGCNLHGLQFRILRRGVELLQVGGRLVYSTCSLNPIENEAVIAAILQKGEGSLELEDVSQDLPGLKCHQGMSTWKVMSRNKEWYSDWEEVPKHLQTQIRPTMFPPPKEQADKFNLDRCRRLLPHHQDTGGFFVAVLRKKEQAPWVSFRGDQLVINFKKSDESSKEKAKSENPEIDSAVESEKDSKSESETAPAGAAEAPSGGDTVSPPSGENGHTKSAERDAAKMEEGASGDKEEEKMESSESGGEKRKFENKSDQSNKRRKGIPGFKEDPFIYLSENDPVWPEIKSFYNFSKDFPIDQLMVRCETGKKRNLYMTSNAVKDVIQHNQDKVKFINTGIKVFARSEAKAVSCDYRLAQEGIQTVFPYMLDRRVPLKKVDIITLLTQENPFFTKMTPELRENLKPIDQGALIFVYEPEDLSELPHCRLLFVGWKGKTSCRSFVPKYERAHYLRLCGVELEDYQKRGREMDQEEEESSSAVMEAGEEGEKKEGATEEENVGGATSEGEKETKDENKDSNEGENSAQNELAVEDETNIEEAPETAQES